QKLKSSLLSLALTTAKSPEKLAEALEGLGSPEIGQAIDEEVARLLGPQGRGTDKGRQLAAYLFANALEASQKPSEIPSPIRQIAEALPAQPTRVGNGQRTCRRMRWRLRKSIRRFLPGSGKSPRPCRCKREAGRKKLRRWLPPTRSGPTAPPPTTGSARHPSG